MNSYTKQNIADRSTHDQIILGLGSGKSTIHQIEH